MGLLNACAKFSLQTTKSQTRLRTAVDLPPRWAVLSQMGGPDWRFVLWSSRMVTSGGCIWFVPAAGANTDPRLRGKRA